MAKSIPLEFVPGSVPNVSRGEDVLSGDWVTVVENQNYLYAHRGSRLRGIVFDEPFTTTSLAYTTANASGGRDLDTIAPTAMPLRKYGASGSNAQFEMRVYGQRAQVRCTIKRLDTGATLTTFVATAGAAFAWVNNVSVPVSITTYADVPLEFTLDVLWTNAGTEASISQIELHETVISATSSLPAG